MVSVTKKPIRLIQLISIGAICFIRPALSYAGLKNTKHDIYPHNKEKNCTLCHIPHSDDTQPAQWMDNGTARVGDEIKFFNMSTDEEVICLSCHDGILAEDICVDFNPHFEEKPSELNLEILFRFYKEMLQFGTCEKHYKLASYFRSHFPNQLKCTTCHDVHLMDGSRKPGLISNKTYYKHKFCLVCHKL
jgi:predicted CXXCH cytochrome family protein